MKYPDCPSFLRNFIKNFKNLNFNRKRHIFKQKQLVHEKNKQLSVKKIIIKIALTESPGIMTKKKSLIVLNIQTIKKDFWQKLIVLNIKIYLKF